MAKSFSQFLIDYQSGELTFKIKVKPATKGDVDKVKAAGLAAYYGH